MTSACAWATGHAAAFHSMIVRAALQNHSDTKPILESSGSLPMPWLQIHSMLTETQQARPLLESPTSPQNEHSRLPAPELKFLGLQVPGTKGSCTRQGFGSTTRTST